ncbi:MAG: pantoate--beta-alanine ligase [Saprospiraceae bacterium]|nr:pantoate--beta-alanine ligase [Bacteroidia bacterium]NNL91162.1 pantoate--beta-alanine ligase [Saprospiraceae bacterium]
MKVLKRVSSIQQVLEKEAAKGKTIGFIPTMGALHMGHMSLIEKSVKENDITVTSVFVNPTQFNQKEDLEKYPRNLKADAKLLKAHGCDYVFAPRVSQIYPKNIDTSVKLEISHLTESMEGPNRPGHFDGVVQVVKRLLDIINPDRIYMGQKDFQQFSIIGYMLRKLKMKTKLRVCPIIREQDGLAMSSRNVRLKKSHRPKCSIIFETLEYAKNNLDKRKCTTICKNAMKRLSGKPFKPEYFEIVDGRTMEKVKNPDDHKLIVACTAVWAGKVRLIDNMILKGKV